MDWLNKNWRKFIRQDDDVIFCSEREIQVCACVAFFVGMVLMLIFGMWGWGLEHITKWIVNGLILAILDVLVAVAIYMYNRSFKYVLTEKGIYEISGWLLKSVTFVSYGRITDVHMSRGLLDAFCKTGSVHVDTASGNTVEGTSVPELSIDGVAEYEEIYNFILSKVK